MRLIYNCEFVIHVLVICLEMLNVSNLGYTSPATVFFQRMSVVLSDLLLAVSSYLLSTQLVNKSSDVLKVFAALVTLPGLFIVDNIHFQYNGFLFGFQLLSIYFLSKGSYVLTAATFALLLNLKHIYLYISPVYFLHLLIFYCLDKNRRFLFANFAKLVFTVVAIFAFCFAPFVFHLPQVMSRLFPFRRGLTHAYWAPNFWAIYNFADVVLAKVLRISEKSGFTSGLVENHQHLVLPQISPAVTLLFTVVAMLVPLMLLFLKGISQKAKRSKNSKNAEQQQKAETVRFASGTVLAAYSSFLFGWHVHEKAVLLIIVPLTVFTFVLSFSGNAMPGILDTQQRNSDVKQKMAGGSTDKVNKFALVQADIVRKAQVVYILCIVPGTVSLYPLLEGLFELPIKLLLLVLYLMVFIPFLRLKLSLKRWHDVFVTAYLFCFVPLLIYVEIFCRIYSCQFLPLMSTSVICSIGLMTSWVLFIRLVVNYDTVESLMYSNKGMGQQKKVN